MGLINVEFFANFRKNLGKDSIQVKANNLGELCHHIEEKYPSLEGELLNEHGEIRKGVIVMVNGRKSSYLEDLETSLQEDDNVSIFPPIAGGCLRRYCEGEC